MLNDFAIRSFRDTADQDYISARLCFRSSLIPQFHWAALQALEKYLKCILVLNRVKAPKTHDLGRLFDLVKSELDVDLPLIAETREFIVYLDTYGRHRYFESSWAIEGNECNKLDCSVWDLRRFASVLRTDEHSSQQLSVDQRRKAIAKISESGEKHPHAFQIPGGLLERIVEDNKHASRPGLIWQNGYFGKSFRTKVKYWPHLNFANSPLTLRPEILDEVLKYVWLSRDMETAYRAHASKVQKSPPDSHA
ncbi:MAG: HEPN domain-containing protein [Acidovorax sp.]|nr:HEPN domain-containing protein [Acidovorax sp.]